MYTLVNPNHQTTRLSDVIDHDAFRFFLDKTINKIKTVRNHLLCQMINVKGREMGKTRVHSNTGKKEWKQKKKKMGN